MHCIERDRFRVGVRQTEVRETDRKKERWEDKQRKTDREKERERALIKPEYYLI